MTSSSAERPSVTAHRIAILAVGALVAAGFTAGFDTTGANLGATKSITTEITTRPACVGDPTAYTSGMLDADTPPLRWSFSGTLPAEATVQPSDAVPTLASVGLLLCDPAALAVPVGTPGSLALAQGAAGSGLTATLPELGTSFTLLLWTSLAPDAPGELASVASTSGELVIGVSAGKVQLTYPDGDTPVTVSSDVLTTGSAHLVAVAYAAKSVELTVDGSPAGSGSTTWEPATAPDAGALTVGARGGSPSAGALVDEVVLASSAYSSVRLAALVEADRWYAPGPL